DPHRSRRQERRAPRSERARLPLRGYRARPGRLAADRFSAGGGRSHRHARSLAERPQRHQLRAAAPGVPDEPRPLGARRRRAAAEPPSAPRQRDRGAAANLGRGLRPHPGRELPAPPRDAAPAADPTGTLDRSQSVRNVINYAPLLRACLMNLDRWVRDGVAPPPSRHPRLDNGTAVPPQTLAAVFDRIPGASYPRHHAMPRRLDFSTLPPKHGPGWGSRVAAVDDDGNERGGIVLPEIAVPLAAFTGWNLRHPEIGGAEQRLAFAGSTLPFAK